MKYSHLKQVVNIIKRELKCSHCGKIFPSEHIDLIDIFENEAVIDAFCPTCDMGITLNIEAQEFAKGVPQVPTSQTATTEITDTEVKSISQILSEHKGGFSELINSSNP